MNNHDEPVPLPIRAPFTEDQVAALNRYQTGPMHPFTCPNGHGSLVCTRDGWTCPGCDYVQDWAHAFMAEGTP